MGDEDRFSRAQLFDTSRGLAPGRGRLAGRSVLVVGAGQRETTQTQVIGNGRSMSLLFAREGAVVFCADRNEDSAIETVRLIEKEGGRARPLQTDVGDPQSVAAMFAEASSHGPLHAAVANVGISSGRKLPEEAPDSWDRVLKINLRGHMLIAQQALEKLVPGGSILFISSGASVSPMGRNPAYETSKAALAALARATAMEGQARGLRANVLAPGLLDTPMGRDASARTPARASRPVPFGRQGTSWEMAYAALFLISTESSYINAQAILLDGGANSHINMPFDPELTAS